MSMPLPPPPASPVPPPPPATPPPPPSKKSNKTLMIVLIILGVQLLLIGGCAVSCFVLGKKAQSALSKYESHPELAGIAMAASMHPDIKVLSDNQNAKGSRDGGMEVMTSLLTAHPQIDAVFAINDPEAIGADLAARQQGRKGIVMTSVDGAPDVEVALKEKGNQVEASASQNPYAMAAKAVEVGFAIAKGTPPADPLTLIPSELVTRENIGSYKGWTAK